MFRTLGPLLASSLAILCLGGCARIISASGVNVYGMSRDEIHSRFGSPKVVEENGTIERFRTRRKVADPMMPPGFDPTFGLVELPLVPKLLWDVQRRAVVGSDLTVEYDDQGRVVEANLDGSPLGNWLWRMSSAPRPEDRSGQNLVDDAIRDDDSTRVEHAHDPEWGGIAPRVDVVEWRCCPVVTNRGEWHRVWAASHPPDVPAPEVDFETHLVWVTHRDAVDPNNVGNSFFVNTEGELRRSHFTTAMSYGGSDRDRLAFFMMSREGIRTVPFGDGIVPLD